jgi:hypothetical protein
MDEDLSPERLDQSGFERLGFIERPDREPQPLRADHRHARAPRLSQGEHRWTIFNA